MNYHKVIPATFLSRSNRFIACVEVDGMEEIVHVKNTGRCKELLVPGCSVYLSCAEHRERKTKYDLIAVEKERAGKLPLLINMDSQLPNHAVEEWLGKGVLFSPDASIRREVTYGRSRFDFYVEDGDRRAFLEVKGVTLENNGVAMFPDAPTERGVKHLQELCDCLQDGFEAYVVFVIQMREVQAFCPNDQTHPAFGNALRQAHAAGVKILALDCWVTADSMSIRHEVPVMLNR